MSGPKGLLCPVDHVESEAAGADPAGVCASWCFRKFLRVSIRLTCIVVSGFWFQMNEDVSRGDNRELGRHDQRVRLGPSHAGSDPGYRSLPHARSSVDAATQARVRIPNDVGRASRARQGQHHALQCIDDRACGDDRHRQHRRRRHGDRDRRTRRTLLDVVYRPCRHGDQVCRGRACSEVPGSRRKGQLCRRPHVLHQERAGQALDLARDRLRDLRCTRRIRDRQHGPGQLGRPRAQQQIRDPRAAGPALRWPC